MVGQLEGALQVDQAAIDNAKLQLTYSRVTAPINGRVGLRLVDVGNIVHANDATGLVVITQVQPITVLFTVPEDDLRAVLCKSRDHERLPVDAYDRAGRRSSRPARCNRPTTRSIRPPARALKAVFDNTDLLFPNQFVNVRLLLDVRKDAVIAPAAAVQRGADGTFVYVVKHDKTVEVRPVDRRPTAGGDAAITSGLAAGEQVVDRRRRQAPRGCGREAPPADAGRAPRRATRRARARRGTASRRARGVA